MSKQGEPVPGATRAAVAAGALFLDEQDRVMLVRPSYKPLWDIPGGYVEPGESPRAACQREVSEELGIQPAIGPLLAVDWAPHPDDGDKLLFVFDGGPLSPDQLGVVRLQTAELAEYRYVPLDQLEELTPARLARRVRAAVAASHRGHPAYLEHGNPMTPE